MNFSSHVGLRSISIQNNFILQASSKYKLFSKSMIPFSESKHQFHNPVSTAPLITKIKDIASRFSLDECLEPYSIPLYRVPIQTIEKFENIPSRFSHYALKVRGSALKVLISHKAHQPSNPGILAQFDQKASKLYLVGSQIEPPIELKTKEVVSVFLAVDQVACIEIDLTHLKKFTNRIEVVRHNPEMRETYAQPPSSRTPREFWIKQNAHDQLLASIDF